ncbi:hypothetical protein M0R89_01885 [Halorussus limi]|uniref:Uncharacterized protein n=1 Tax=Halorussus limi TaxID=2938695 RepID=A0A8U0HVR3_9EURY|nr:hypothetical protein [Halorussus limi]UPV74833.1 hypothetical protein M0R89_01885 [Halorussus limi]
MATTADADSTASDAGSRRDATVVSGPDESADAGAERATTGENGGNDGNGDSSSLADKLDTAGTVIWVGFLAAIVVFTLIPVVGLAVGTPPFDPPPTAPYFAFVGVAFVGTVALVGGAILDV